MSGISTGTIIVQDVTWCGKDQSKPNQFKFYSIECVHDELSYLIFYLPQWPTGLHLNHNCAWIQNDFSALDWTEQGRYTQLTWIKSLLCEWITRTALVNRSLSGIWAFSLFLGTLAPDKRPSRDKWINTCNDADSRWSFTFCRLWNLNAERKFQH